MIASFFPLKKLRRNGKCLLFVAILVFAALAVYHEFVVTNPWIAHTRMYPASENSWRRAASDKAGKDYQPDSEDSAAWRSSYTPQAWKPEYKGQANLHIFEDWCGSSTAQLRENLHYPLYPHSRTTVKKLAVSPQWTNYGLRIFGYLHPYTDGEFVFAVSSDDNSEFWLSQDDSPLHLQLVVWVGKTGTEWTAPGEFEKYASQVSQPVRLSAQRRYFFEILHKQNDRGTDHVEVAWKLLDEGFRFMVIESMHISLYINESALLMSDVAHIPQTAASHTLPPRKQPSVKADMLREDPRDILYHVPLINSRFLQGVLPDCSYKPSYIIKGIQLLRYQGLQFVHMSYIYPNDYTRLTHMETENSCFYHLSPFYPKRFGFAKYMRLDRLEGQERGDTGRANQHQKIVNTLLQDYRDDYDDYAQRHRRKIFSLDLQKTETELRNTSNTGLHIHRMKSRRGKGDVLQPLPAKPETPAAHDGKKPAEQMQSMPTLALKHHRLQEHNGAELEPGNTVRQIEQIIPTGRPRPAKRQKRKLVETEMNPGQRNPPIAVQRVQARAKARPAGLSQNPQVDSKRRVRRPVRKSKVQRLKNVQPQPLDRNVSMPEKPIVAQQRRYGATELQLAAIKRSTTAEQDLREKVTQKNLFLQQDTDNTTHRAMTDRSRTAKGWLDKREEDKVGDENEVTKIVERRSTNKEVERDSWWGPGDPEGGNDEYPAYDHIDPEVNWRQTFQLNPLDLQALRSDWLDLQCNVSGNLILHANDAQLMVKAFMDQFNHKHRGRFTLVRVVNVEKRVDGAQGSRYLLELELKEPNGQLLRLSHYIYALIRQRKRKTFMDLQRSGPQLLLCNPVGFRWNPAATVHFIVPVKNQARWVQQMIVDMEELYKATGDPNFELIITDYNSTDMDVEKALRTSTLRFQYIKLSGNFERSAGLQAGIDLISDDHSIVFLCDLHIRFPHSIVDTIRKHCVEGHMAFAPIVMRMDCGATPSDPRGYWEVNGFGLLGIYKSDLDAAGGMNTREFKDRWGGEDWELLDRILQSGLEVERIYLRNFFHHYHSKRGMWNRRILPDPR